MDNIGIIRNAKKIIVYGAGRGGKILLERLWDEVQDKDVEVWDASYDEIDSICGFSVLKPCFEHRKNCSDVVVLISLYGKNINASKEIRLKFLNHGYKNVILFDDIWIMKVNKDKPSAYDESPYQANMDFSSFESKVKSIAFYLPQYHEVIENSEWWGEGFTEWVNTKKAKPRFRGHYQPREPHDDIGYYDLSDVEAIKKQARLAKQHGIYGWAIYYYWFSGKKILYKPIDILFENKDIDIKFCLTWCNNPWTKEWIGKGSEVLIENKYLENDPISFIDDISEYLKDTRYIKFDDKPLIIIYSAHTIPNIKELLFAWRKRAHEIGIGDIAIFSALNPISIQDMGLQGYLEGELVFAPTEQKKARVHMNCFPQISMDNRIFLYESLFDEYRRFISSNDSNIYHCSMCGWDNSARYDDNFRMLDFGFTFKLFYHMTKFIAEDAERHDKEFIFVFAWNEWAEAAYLEPDKRFGYAMINTFSKAIYGLPFEWRNNEGEGDA